MYISFPSQAYARDTFAQDALKKEEGHREPQTSGVSEETATEPAPPFLEARVESTAGGYRTANTPTLKQKYCKILSMYLRSIINLYSGK